jgi:hypothetical protein
MLKFTCDDETGKAGVQFALGLSTAENRCYLPRRQNGPIVLCPTRSVRLGERMSMVQGTTMIVLSWAKIVAIPRPLCAETQRSSTTPVPYL